MGIPQNYPMVYYPVLPDKLPAFGWESGKSKPNRGTGRRLPGAVDGGDRMSSQSKNHPTQHVGGTILVVMMACVVGFIVLSVLLPLMEMQDQIGG